MKMTNLISDIANFYIDGFRQMKVGKKLWLLIAIKLLILFGVMKIFFFPNYLKTNYPDDKAKSQHLMEHLTKENK